MPSRNFSYKPRPTPVVFLHNKARAQIPRFFPYKMTKGLCKIIKIPLITEEMLCRSRKRAQLLCLATSFWFIYSNGSDYSYYTV